jgi:ribosome-associated protein
MSTRALTAALLKPELVLTTSRSSGAGGQNVNKVNTRVTLRFDVSGSQILTSDEKEILLRKLAGKLRGEGVLIVSSQENRSQLQNRESVTEKFEKIMAKAFEKKKRRKATKPSKSSVQERLKNKKAHSEKKKFRQNPF